MILPQRLRRGDTIALLAPSGGFASVCPHRLDAARRFLEGEGFKIKEYPTTRGSFEGSSGTIEDRVRDLHEAFKDPIVKGIICTTGGLSCNELVPYIDFKLLRANPKVFCGYSDISILHYALRRKTGLVTFYGPAAMTQFGEHPSPLHYTIEHFRKAVLSAEPIGRVEPSAQWTEEILDWTQKKDLERARTLQPNKGHEWLREGTASGPIIGGCLHSILKLRGTEYDADYREAILFIETPEGEDFTKGESPRYIQSQLADLKVGGILKKIQGLIIGRFYGQTPQAREQLKDYIQRLTREYTFPILYGADIGHTDPQITIPLGVQATLNSSNNQFSIDESGVE